MVDFDFKNKNDILIISFSAGIIAEIMGLPIHILPIIKYNGGSCFYNYLGNLHITYILLYIRNLNCVMWA